MNFTESKSRPYAVSAKRSFLKTMQRVDPQKRDTPFQGIASGDQYGGATKMAQTLYKSIEAL